MKYRGFDILKKYGGNCRPPREGEGTQWVNYQGAFEGFAIYDPMEEDRLWDIYSTREECIKEIDRVCDVVLKMDSNCKTSWAKLEGYQDRINRPWLQNKVQS